MFDSIIALVMSVFGLIVNLPGQLPNPPKPIVDQDNTWTCQAKRWTDSPKVQNNLFTGTIEDVCTLEGKNGGGYSILEKHLNDRVKEKSTQVNSGPTAETYKNLPSTYYDVTIVAKSDKTQVNIEQEVHIATDREQLLVFDTFSKKITGTGNAKYLKKVDIGFDANRNSEPNSYQIRIWTTTKIEKPSFVPVGMFQSQVKQSIEQQFDKHIDEVMGEIADNI